MFWRSNGSRAPRLTCPLPKTRWRPPPALFPMRFIDAHMHFWDQAVLQPYIWLHEVPAIAHAHTPLTLKTESEGALPEKIVFVECGAPWLDEVRWVEQLAVQAPRIA